MAENIKTKISAVDKFVKTFEAWWAFGACVMTIAAAMTAATIWATPKLLDVGWPYWVLVGVPMLFITALACRFLIWKWSIWKFPSSDTLDEKLNTQETQMPPLSKSSLEEILGRISALEKINPSDELTEYVARYVGDATAKMDRLEGTFDEKFDSLVETNNRGIDALFVNKKTSDVMKFAELAEILDAKNHLERFDEVSAEIDEAVKHLDKIPLCENWSGRHQYFKGRLNEWDSFRNHYSIPEYKPLFEVEPNELKSAGWSAPVNKLPTDEGIEYKHYRLALQAYRKNHKHMRSRISDIAKKSFYGLTAKGSYMERFER